MAERDIHYGGQPLEYVAVDLEKVRRTLGSMSNYWGTQTPLATCVRCGRYMDDPNRDPAGEPMHEHPEDDVEAVCMPCLEAALDEALRAGMVETIEATLGLGETDRQAIKAFIETIFTDPRKILRVQDLDNRVRHLEEQNKLLWTVLIGAIIVMLIALLAALL